jgi:hypothetical protein
LRAKLIVELFREVNEPLHIEGPMWVPLKDHALVLTVRTPKPARRVEVDASLSFGVGVEVGTVEIGIQAVLGESCQAVRRLIEEVRDALV